MIDGGCLELVEFSLSIDPRADSSLNGRLLNANSVPSTASIRFDQ